MDKSFSHQPRKRFGQHFLKDPSVLDKIMVAIAPQSSDHLVEIGPGQGALTRQLLSTANRLDAIELDRNLVALLAHDFSQEKKLYLHESDALIFDFKTLPVGTEPLRIVGNLPYNISTPLFFKLFAEASIIQDMHFMLQKEVVDRVTATVGSPHYGRLSVMAQYFSENFPLFFVEPEAFSPPPQVNSAFIRMIPRKQRPSVDCLDTLSAVVREAFTYRRKTLKNSLKRFVSEQELKHLGIDPNQRAQELTLDDFVKISNMVNSLS